MGKSTKRFKVLQAVSEVVPFITTGGMGQVAGALAKALASSNEDLDVRVVAPLYASFRETYERHMRFLGATEVQLAWRSVYCGIYELESNGLTFYFVDNRHYFDRERAYGHYDDGERFAFFCKAVFKVIEATGFVPDVIHSHDWQTSLIPIYLKTHFSDRYTDMRSVFTIHNVEYQGKYPSGILFDVFDMWENARGLVEYDGCINLMKGAIVSCDKLTTVSPSYAIEIQSGGGYGLDPIIAENAYKLKGIVNGIDTELYDPATDTLLCKNYTSETLDDKAYNKREVQALFHLPVAPRKMLICIVSRLVSHKGIDLVTCLMDDLLKMDIQFLLLGTGDHAYELFFEEKAVVHPDKVAVSIAFNPNIAGKIYAGADVILMPSRSEPCGLAQMIACRYGTIPIVRATGGLKDTIKDCRLGNGNGFTFEEYTSGALLDTIRQAHDLYNYREQDWKNLMRESMACDFGWDVSAREYANLYRELL